MTLLCKYNNIWYFFIWKKQINKMYYLFECIILYFPLKTIFRLYKQKKTSHQNHIFFNTESLLPISDPPGKSGPWPCRSNISWETPRPQPGHTQQQWCRALRLQWALQGVWGATGSHSGLKSKSHWPKSNTVKSVWVISYNKS